MELTRILQSRIDPAIAKVCGHPNRLVGTSLLRVGLSLVAIHLYVSHLRVREFLWGPNGAISSHQFDQLRSAGRIRPNVFAFARTNQRLDVLLGLGLIVAVLFLFIGGRAITIIHTVFMFGLLERNYLITDGGDSLMLIVLPFLALTINNSRFSLVSSRVESRVYATPNRHARNALHNIASVVIVGQVALVYFAASLWKLGGEEWRNGTAMYFIGNTDDYTLVRIPEMILNNPVTTTMLTYSVIVIQALVAPCLLARRRLTLLTPLLLSMHVGIGLFMGLVSFAATMATADLMLLNDESYERSRRFFRRYGDALTHFAQRGRRVDESENALEAGSVARHGETLVPDVFLRRRAET